LNWRLAALKNGFKDYTAYRVEFLMEILGNAIVPAAIQWVLWYAIFKTDGATELAGMTYVQMLHYTLVSVLFNQVRGGDQDFELAEMIRTGQLSNYLIRPVGLIQFIYIRGVASKLLISALSLAIGIVLSVSVLSSEASPLRMIGAMLLALLGNVIHFQIGAVLSAMAFRWEDAYGLLMVKNMAVSILSGELLPLNLFPESMSWIWKSTPFYLYVFGPAQYALGEWTHLEFVRQLGVAFLWIFVLWVLIRFTWGLGIKKYVSLGG